MNNTDKVHVWQVRFTYENRQYGGGDPIPGEAEESIVLTSTPCIGDVAEEVMNALKIMDKGDAGNRSLVSLRNARWLGTAINMEK